MTAEPIVDLLDLLRSAAENATRAARRYYSPYPAGDEPSIRENRLQATEKDETDPRTVVSKADLDSEKIIFSTLRGKLDCAFLSEEAGALPGGPQTEYRVIIDSLDGSRNFVRGSNGLFGISIAIEHRGWLVAGALALPYFDEILVVERGKGVYYLKSSVQSGNQKQDFASFLMVFGILLAQRPGVNPSVETNRYGHTSWVSRSGSKPDEEKKSKSSEERWPSWSARPVPP